jgi:metal-responsive CopG/Arc/MetJ family transcriptional regulator
MAVKEKVTLTLPQDLWETVCEMAPPRGQSQLVAEALTYFIEMKQRENLRAELIAGYQATAERDLKLVREWEPLGFDAWEGHVPPYEEESEHETADS